MLNILYQKALILEFDTSFLLLNNLCEFTTQAFQLKSFISQKTGFKH